MVKVVQYALHCVCYVESFQMSGTIMGLACVRVVRVGRMVMVGRVVRMGRVGRVESRAFK